MAPRRPQFDELMLARRRRAAESLRREVMGADGSLDHPYFRALERELRDYESPATLGEIVEAATDRELIYVGDFHALPTSQLFAADLLEALAPRVRSLAVGVEFVATRQQAWLDRRQAGLLDDAALRRRIRYAAEWGYPWSGYGAVLDRARRLGIAVHALDVGPRGGFAGLRRRDEHAARRIAGLIEREPALRLLVLFGESHVARAHLPRQVARHLARVGLTRRELVVVQNPDRLHWRALEREGRSVPAVRVDGSTFAVLHTAPLEKYEAYRQVLDGWRHGDGGDELDMTPAVHHLVDTLVRWLGLRAARRRIRHRGGWSEGLADAYPEVYGGDEAGALLEPILAEHGRGHEEIVEARARLRRGGALYDGRSNAMFIARYVPGPAAAECARFLRAALTGRLYVAGDEFVGDPAAAMYGAAYVEALATLGARLVDPADRPASGAPAPAVAAGCAAASRPVVAAAERRSIELHRRFERGERNDLPAELLRTIAVRRAARRAVARDVGRRLGAALFDRARRGELGTAELRRLFTRPLAARTVAPTVLGLLRG